jgi:hypothetical protein
VWWRGGPPPVQQRAASRPQASGELVSFAAPRHSYCCVLRSGSLGGLAAPHTGSHALPRTRPPSQPASQPAGRTPTTYVRCSVRGFLPQQIQLGLAVLCVFSSSRRAYIICDKTSSCDKKKSLSGYLLDKRPCALLMPTGPASRTSLLTPARPGLWAIHDRRNLAHSVPSVLRVARGV